MKNRWRRSARKNQEEIQKRIAEVERQKAEEREADRERKRERGPAVLRKQGLKLLGRKISPVHSVKHHHVIPAFYIS